jgi:hypothetical protein
VGPRLKYPAKGLLASTWYIKKTSTLPEKMKLKTSVKTLTLNRQIKNPYGHPVRNQMDTIGIEQSERPIFDRDFCKAIKI